MSSTEKRQGRTSKRDQLLDAAASIVSTQGVQHLTIEAVAAAANVTKAGLIYHFKTRDDLLSALVERLIKDFDVQANTAQRPVTQALTTKSALNKMSIETFDMPSDLRQLMANLLAAVSFHPQLMPPVQALYARNYDWLAQNSEQVDQALVIAAALDGIALLELLNLHQFTSQQRDAMRGALESAIRALP
ncbi:TetR family transcriptional regulator [Pseudoduganella sp. FT93W]|uniref:TetR family transcriptional regulator n=1 Tax=Duganella fentianensis TaxID=2692177 RepID=A0A845I248_9BURK|nr:TetR/AcrR family transcriptional regulator [Duganella fentianensis]MYN44778.1 TetR family transcriptional regulator [Duganella fentianensis]